MFIYFPINSMERYIYIVWEVKVKSLSRVWLFETPWTVAYKVHPSVEFSSQEYWSGLPFPSLGGLPNPGIEPGSPAMQADDFTIWATWNIYTSMVVDDSGWMEDKDENITWLGDKDFLMIVILAVMRWYIIFLFTFISLRVINVEHLFHLKT